MILSLIEGSWHLMNIQDTIYRKTRRIRAGGVACSNKYCHATEINYENSSTVLSDTNMNAMKNLCCFGQSVNGCNAN